MVQPDANLPPTTHGSQGWGGMGGLGYFLDEGGRDIYVGVDGHDDDTSQSPTPESTGFFEDRNSGAA